MTTTISGWLLDVYPNETNLTVWLIGQDGQRHRFVQDFAASLYAAGPAARLRQLWNWLMGQPVPVRLARAERQDVFHGMASATHVPTGCCAIAETADPQGRFADGGLSQGDTLSGTRASQRPPRLVTVLAIEVLQPARLDELFRGMVAAFPDLTWYDADISIPLRYAAAFNVFPLARVRLEVTCTCPVPSGPPVPAAFV